MPEFWSLISIGQVNKNGITYQKTKLGLIISGQIVDQGHVKQSVSCLSLNELNRNLENFWKIDEFMSNNPILTPDEQYCQNYFENTTTRDTNGQFIVRLPFKPNLNQLGNSYDTALSRLKSLEFGIEKQFQRDSHLKIEYTKFLNEYKELNDMTELTNNSENLFYLPHHAVIKDSSETTKDRVVFDGSCQLSEGLSINELMHAGPNIQNEIFSIIARCRLYEFILTGDIEKMYRQFLVHPDDRKYQVILWRTEPEQEINIYQLNTVTYGTTAAPYLAVRCLQQIAIETK